MKTISPVLSGLLLGACCILTCSSEPLPILVVTGQNNHDWKATTPEIVSALEAHPALRPAVLTTPTVSTQGTEWQDFRPDFSRYKAVVLNWTDFGSDPAPGEPRVRPWMNQLFDYVKSGGGLVVVHAASFEHHPEWGQLKGLGWSMTNEGYRLSVDDTGKVSRLAPGQGHPTGHKAPAEWVVRLSSKSHPIIQGLPRSWSHCRDELWYSTRGPAANLTVLAVAFSPETKLNEPIIWTVDYGKGRVFVTLMGHDAGAMKCLSFQHLLARGTEWAATAEVSPPKPENFPAKPKP